MAVLHWNGGGVEMEESLREEGTLVGNGMGERHYWFMAREERRSFIRTEMPTNISI